MTISSVENKQMNVTNAAMNSATARPCVVVGVCRPMGRRSTSALASVPRGIFEAVREETQGQGQGQTNNTKTKYVRYDSSCFSRPPKTLSEVRRVLDTAERMADERREGYCASQGIDYRRASEYYYAVAAMERQAGPFDGHAAAAGFLSRFADEIAALLLGAVAAAASAAWQLVPETPCAALLALLCFADAVQGVVRSLAFAFEVVMTESV